MKVTDLKINGICNPVGFAYPVLRCSWKVTAAKSKKQTNVKIVVSPDVLFQEAVYIKEGSALNCAGELLELDLQPFTKYYYYIVAEGEDAEKAQSEVAYFQTGRMGEEWQAEFISTQSEDKFHPEFFHDFIIEREVREAYLTICGLGVYETYLNGEKVGADYLAPFTGDYHQKLQTQMYDVTELLKPQNDWRILCGNGWYKGRLGYQGGREIYGNRFLAIAELRILYKDGTKEVISTNDSWKYRGSDIEMSDIYDGEVFNRLLWQEQSNEWRPAVVVNENKGLLTDRESLPLKEKEELTVKEMLRTPADETVLDFGQNFSGYVEFDANFKAGTKVTLEFGEILQNDNFYRDNYRTAKAAFTYISDGRRETVRPHFTFFGFRYVRITGWDGELSKDMFRGKVIYSDLTITGKITTSHAKLNRLFENCMWGQKSNFLDMPTDCPQRDERLGWTGDAQVFAPTASLNMDTRAFFAKYLADLRVEQQKWNGAIPNYIPNEIHAPGGSSVWGDAATFIPMTLYEYYGDKIQLENHYPMMKDWVDYITAESEKNGNHHLFDFGMHFGDWLAMDGVTEQSFKGGTEDYFIASVYYYASAVKVAQAALILNKQQDYETYLELASQIKAAVLAEYFTVGGRLAIDTQAAYIICLRFAVYAKRERVIEGLKLRLEKDCYRIKCGFVGAPVMCQVLSENGMTDLAYRLLFYEGFPSWLRCVNLGATTIWERWNSVLDDGSISGTGMNSLNHYAYGSVVEFLYCYAAGIRPAKPGFHQAYISPRPDYRLREMDCTYDSVCGEYGVAWKIKANGAIRLQIRIPFNCTAKVLLPDSGKGEITLEAGNHQFEYLPTRDYTRPFGADSTLEELAEYPEAMKILAEYLPAAVGMIASQDKESMALTLEKLKGMFYLGFETTTVETVISLVEKVRVQTGSGKS